MSDRRSSMLATLADLKSKPSTPNRRTAISNIESAMAANDANTARAPRGGGTVRSMTIYDREELMRIEADPDRPAAVKFRAKEILAGGSNISKGDAEFLKRATGK